jgi:hypothetical protein
MAITYIMETGKGGEAVGVRAHGFGSPGASRFPPPINL